MTPPPIELSVQQLDALIDRLKARNLSDKDYEVLEAMSETIKFLNHSLDEKGASIKRLLKMIFGASTEKTESVVKKPKPDHKEPKKRKKAMAETQRRIIPVPKRSRLPMVRSSIKIRVRLV